MVGDGIAIKTTTATKWSPLLTVPSAKSLKPTMRSIESDSGIELPVHFGIDTVELKRRRLQAYC
ncbi:PTS glucose transporter subunit IIA [Salmonella enterica subsp. enterica]|nr:PTS glucose transporter subunit IIA [Salmonella enterica subsp. enterica]